MSRTTVGLAADRPARAARGREYVAEDTNQSWISDGTDWIETSNVVGGGAAGRQLVDSHRETTPGYPSWANGANAGPSYGEPAVANGPGWTVVGDNDGSHLALVTVSIPKFYVTNIPAGVAIASIEFGADDGTSMHTMGTWIQEKAPSPEGGNYAELVGSAIIEPWEGELTFEFKTWGSPIDCNAAISSDYAGELSVPFLLLEWLD